MSLITCHECGRQVSSEAAACPNCGAPPRIANVGTPLATVQLTSKRLKLYLVIAAILFWGGIVTSFTFMYLATSGPILWTPEVEPVTEARVWHILIKVEPPTEAGEQAALEQVQALRKRIVKGERFAKLAQEFSTDPSSNTRGGDLGWIRRGELTEAIDQYIWTAPINEVSPVLVSSYGLHLVLVTERYFSDAEKYEEELKERVLQGSPSSGKEMGEMIWSPNLGLASLATTIGLVLWVVTRIRIWWHHS